jgi:hypothetical protein
VKLEEEQNRVNVYLVQLLAGVMMPGELAKYLQARNMLFSLDWETFYEELDRRLLAEAFARYTTWGNRPGRVRRDKKRSRAPRGKLPKRPDCEDTEILEMVAKKRKLDS